MALSNQTREYWRQLKAALLGSAEGLAAVFNQALAQEVDSLSSSIDAISGSATTPRGYFADQSGHSTTSTTWAEVASFTSDPTSKGIYWVDVAGVYSGNQNSQEYCCRVRVNGTLVESFCYVNRTNNPELVSFATFYELDLVNPGTITVSVECKAESGTVTLDTYRTRASKIGA